MTQTAQALAETKQAKARADEALAESEAASGFLVEAFGKPHPNRDGATVTVHS